MFKVQILVSCVTFEPCVTYIFYLGYFTSPISIVVAEKPIYISCYQEFTFLTADKTRLADRIFPYISNDGFSLSPFLNLHSELIADS